MDGLEGKVILVAGLSSGIGHAIAKRLLADGGSIIVHGIDPSRSARLAGVWPSANGVSCERATTVFLPPPRKSTAVPPGSTL